MTARELLEAEIETREGQMIALVREIERLEKDLRPLQAQRIELRHEISVRKDALDVLAEIEH